MSQEWPCTVGGTSGRTPSIDLGCVTPGLRVCTKGVRPPTFGLCLDSRPTTGLRGRTRTRAYKDPTTGTSGEGSDTWGDTKGPLEWSEWTTSFLLRGSRGSERSTQLKGGQMRRCLLCVRGNLRLGLGKRTRLFVHLKRRRPGPDNHGLSEVRKRWRASSSMS